MAHLDQQPADAAGSDLRARIQERVEQRRRAGQPSRGQLQMSRAASSVNGHSADTLDETAPAAGLDGTSPVIGLGGTAAAGLDGTSPATGRNATSPATGLNGSGTSGGVTEPVSGPAAATDADRASGADLASDTDLSSSTDLSSDTDLSNRADASRAFRLRQPATDGVRHRHAAVPPGPGLLYRAARWALLLAITAAAVFGLRQYVIASYYIPSASMETTLHGCPGCQPDMVLVDKLSYRFKSVARRDVVVFGRPPLAPPEDQQLIKRVIGLPGEVVSGHDGHVFINNKELIEPYVDPSCHGTADFPAVRVPAGRYFVMGDNRCNSFDSRMFGTIPRSAVIGRAFAVMWPVHHLRWL